MITCQPALHGWHAGRLETLISSQCCVQPNSTYRYAISRTIFRGRITLAAHRILPILTRFSVAWSVCTYVVCHIRAPCLNRSPDLHVIWQVHLWGSHCVRWVPDPQGKKKFRGPLRLQIAAEPSVLCCNRTNIN